MLTAAVTIESDWPDEEPGRDSRWNDDPLDDFDDDDVPLEIDDDWDPFAADDDYEPEPEYGDFWTEIDGE